MEHNNMISLLQEMAMRHRDIRHGQDDGKGKPRNSFFRQQNEEVLSLATNAAYPCMVLLASRGQFERGSAINDTVTISYLVLCQLAKDSADNDAIQQAWSESKRIGTEMIAYINDQMENHRDSEFVQGFLMDSVQWQQVGPVDNNTYGTLFSLQVKDEAYNPYQIQIDDIFPTQNI